MNNTTPNPNASAETRSFAFALGRRDALSERNQRVRRTTNGFFWDIDPDGNFDSKEDESKWANDYCDGYAEGSE